MIFRKVTLADAPALAAIYNEAIGDAIISAGNEEPVTVESREQWIRNKENGYPIYVLEGENGIEGYGFYDRFVFRPGINSVSQIAVFIAREHRNRLAGARILMNMLREAPALGFEKVITLIFSENVSSIRANAYLMNEFMTIPRGAVLRNRHLDIVWFDLDMDFLQNPGDPRTKLIEKYAR